MKLWLGIGVLVLSFGCSTTKSAMPENEKKALDIPLEKSVIEPPQATAAPATQKVEPMVTNGDSSKKSGFKMEGDVELNWERFFQKDPDLEQRRKIAAALKNSPKPRTAKQMLENARKEIVLSKYSAAEITLREALREDRDCLPCLLELAQLQLRRSRPERSFETLAAARTIIETSPDLDRLLVFRYRYILASSFLASADLDKGRKILSELIGLDRTFSPAYAALAASYMHQGKIKVAKFIANRGLDRGAETPSLHNVLGAIALEESRPAKAKQKFEKALSISSTYVPAMVNLANLMIRRQQFESAEVMLNDAIGIQPNHIPAHIALAITQKRTGRLEVAKSTLEKAIQIDPESSLARFNLAIVMLRLEEPGQALRLFHEVLQTDSSNRAILAKSKIYIEDIKENHL